MITSAVEFAIPDVADVSITEDTIMVELNDERTIYVPLEWYLRLVHGSPEEHQNWRPVGQGQGMHWEDFDEDISVENLLEGKPSGESQASLKRWLAGRQGGQTRP